MIQRIHALKQHKIIWPASWDDPHVDSPIFIASIDGTHCPIQEPTKGLPWNKNPKFMSYKFHGAALSYEVAVSIYTSQLVWINGPFPAGTQDPEIFVLSNGLKNRIPAGKKVIADRAYGWKSLANVVRIKNRGNTAEVRMFKRQVRARMESVFAKMKVFDILTIPFRHEQKYHGTIFEMIAVIVQYKLELVPLFDA